MEVKACAVYRAVPGCGISGGLSDEKGGEEMGKKLKVQDEIEGTDTPLSRLCDKFLDERAEVEVKRKTFQATEKELIQTMKSAGKKSIKHGGVTRKRRIRFRL